MKYKQMQCNECGIMLERASWVDRAVCFECKKKSS